MTGADAYDLARVGLEEVVRDMPAAVVIVDAGSRRIIHVNPAARAMSEERIGRRIPAQLTDDWEIYHPDGRLYRPEEWPLIRSITAGETVIDEEYFNRLPSGDRLRVRCSSSPVYDADGKISAGVLVMTDITEQRAREEHLRYLAGLLDNTEDAIVALDARWYVTVWNKGAERMYGWTAAEVLGRHTLEVARLDMSYEERDEVRRETAARGRWRGEVVAYRKDGTAVTVELITVALRDEGGDLTGFLGIHRDVTERKRAQQALEEAHRRSETILESISDAFVAVDGDWRYTYVNQRALRRMKWRSGRPLTREDILGQDIWEMFPDTVGTTIESRYREAMHERREVRFETYFPPHDEWIEAHVYPFGAGLSIYFRDVSDRKRAEEERESRTRQQEIVAELGLRALAAADLQALMDEAVAVVAQTLDVELAGIAELVRGRDAFVFRAGVGWRDGVVGRRIEDEGRASLMGYTIGCRQPVTVEDMATDQRFEASAISRNHGVVSAQSVMIESPDEPFGVLAALSVRRRTFSPSDVSFLQAVANVLASAVERWRAQEQIIEVKDLERRRIARDLHDEALSHLTLATIEGVRLQSLSTDSDARERLERQLTSLKRAGDELRGVIYGLRLPAEEDRPFLQLLEGLVASHRRMAAGGDIVLESGEGVPSGSLGAAGTEVLLVVSEALTNARRHSGARTIRVRVSGSAGPSVCVEVIDDGVGFDLPEHPAGLYGAGIAGMRERAALLGAQLQIRTVPGKGTRLRLAVELPAQA